MFIYKGKLKVFDHSYSKELSKIIHQDYEIGIKPSNHKNISYRLEKFLILNGISDILSLINGILSLIESIFYMISTYTFPETSNTKTKINEGMEKLETAFLVYFITHFVLRLYCSQNRILFCFDLINFLDIVSSICLILSRQDFAKYEEAGYFFRVFRIFRLSYLGTLENIVQRKTDERIRHLYRLIVNLLSVIFIIMSLFLEFENNNIRTNFEPRELRSIVLSDILNFHDVIYFILVSITTIGFGDITPQSILGKLLICSGITFLIPYLEIVRSEMENVFSFTSKYALMKYKKKKRHLLLIGNCGPESYEACLQELYNEDHGDIDFDTIIMQLKANKKMIKMLNKNKYKKNIYYIEGDVLNHLDLDRAGVYSSDCVIILANKLNNQREEDFNNILKAMAIQNNAIKNLKNDMHIYIQLIQPESKEIYYTSLSNLNEQGPQIICLEELKLQILGKSCHCRGINTIITALTTSEKPSMNSIKDLRTYSDWMEEYLKGLENEIYRIKIKCEYLYNLTFIDLVKIIYDLTKFIVIGTDVIYKDIKPFVCLNPSNYQFSPFDHLVYLLASKQPNETEINQLIENYLEGNKKGIIKNNKKMVKIRRLKVNYWAKLNRNYEPIIKKDEYEGQEENNDIGTKAEDNVELKYFQNNILKNKLNSYSKNKVQEFNYINKKNFITKLKPRTQSESEYFSTELLENHIIICGLNPNIKHMIMPLRLKSNIKIYPILIIDQNEHIPSQIWTEIQYFPDIYYMKGDLRKQEYLLRAGVANALAVIILAKYNSEYESQGMLDINSIFIYNSIKRIFNKTLIIADLLSINSIELLSQKNENLEEYGFWLNQAFISGELYINSMLDTLICQAFYNPYIVNIITQMMLGESAFKFDEEKTNDLNKDKLLKSSLYLFKIKGLLEKYKYDNMAGIIETHHISFKSLFEFLIENNKVPIGVLRNLDGIHKFVFLAPDTDTLIDIEKDKVYIISSEESSGLDDRNKNYSEKYSIDLIEKSNAMLNDLAEIIKRDMDEINYKLQKDLNVKELIGITRMQLQKELINVHEKEMEKIIKDIPSELKKNTEEIKEDSNEIENSSNSD